MKVNNFRGDLTDISAKKEALNLTDAWVEKLHHWAIKRTGREE